MVCNVNKLNVISVILHNNIGEQFVINYDIRKIIIKKVPSKLRIGEDTAQAEFLSGSTAKSAVFCLYDIYQH